MYHVRFFLFVLCKRSSEMKRKKKKITHISVIRRNILVRYCFFFFFAQMSQTERVMYVNVCTWYSIQLCSSRHYVMQKSFREKFDGKRNEQRERKNFLRKNSSLLMFICTSGGSHKQKKIYVLLALKISSAKLHGPNKKWKRLFRQACIRSTKTYIYPHTHTHIHCMYNNRICMIVIILNVTWSVYIYYSTLNTFLPASERNETNINTKNTNKIDHCWIEPFIFRCELLHLAMMCVVRAH